MLEIAAKFPGTDEGYCCRVQEESEDDILSDTPQRQPVSGTLSGDAETTTAAGTSARLRPAFENYIRQSLHELRVGRRAVIAESRSRFFGETEPTSYYSNA